MKLFLGHILIKKSNNELYVITKFKNSNLVVMKSMETGINENVSFDYIADEYILLTPVGYVGFNIVDMNDNTQDIIVSISRLSDMENNISTPYAVCRQCIVDFMYQQINPNSEMVGMSVSKDTCPANVNYENMLICNEVKDGTVVAVYLDYTLDYILSFIKQKDFNNILSSIYSDHAMFMKEKFGQIGYDQVIQKNHHNGYCKDLKTLLDINNFMYDFYRAFNIYNIKFTNLEEREGKSLNTEEVKILSDILCKNIDSTLIVKYNYDIDLKNIGGPHILLADEDGKLFVIAYIEDKNNPYRVPIETVESDSNIYQLNDIMTKAGKNDSNIRKAYDYIVFNSNKYN